MVKHKLLVLGSLLAMVGLGSAAQAATTAGCGMTSPLKSRNAAGTVVSAASVFPDSGNTVGFQVPTFVATGPDSTIVLLIPSGSQWTERPLYWPTPNDPRYAYRKMRRLPTSTKLIGNDYGQRIEVITTTRTLMVDGVSTTYTPIDYNGFFLVIDGCGGNDDLRGGNGSDHLYDYSGEGNELRGFGGRDWIEGLANYMSGGDGDDCMYGLGNAIDMQGNAGDDALDADPGYLSTKNNGGDGTDSCSAAIHAACESVAPNDCSTWLD